MYVLGLQPGSSPQDCSLKGSFTTRSIVLRKESVLSGMSLRPWFSTRPSSDTIPSLHTSAFLAFRLRTDAVDTWRSQVSQDISAFPDLMPPNIGSLVIPVKGIRLLRWSV